MTEAIYRGYSTVGRKVTDSEVYDLDIIVQDLLNEFNTRLGERVGRPEFGSIIWDLMFDIGDTRTENLVIQDAQRIIGRDPRAVLLDLKVAVDLDGHTITVNAHIRASETDQTAWLQANFRT